MLNFSLIMPVVFIFTSIMTNSNAAANDKQVPPLIQAIENREIEKVSSLIKNGADVNLKYNKTVNYHDEQGLVTLVFTPAEYAVWRGDLKIAKIILSEGKVSDKFGVLMKAIEVCDSVDYSDLSKFILFMSEKGLDINAKDRFGTMPLMLAVRNGCPATCEALLMAGADVNAKNTAGLSALAIAVMKNDSDERKRTQLFNVLKKYNAHDLNAELLYAIQQNNKKDVTLLLENGASANATNDNLKDWTWTALMIAVEHGQLDIVSILLDKGADINLKNRVGRTALCFAVKNKNHAISQLLVDKGSLPALDCKW